jgi:hypothetical protein
MLENQKPQPDAQTTGSHRIGSADLTSAQVDGLRDDREALRRRLRHISTVAAMALAGRADVTASLKAIEADAEAGADHGR